ncbi:MAG: lysine--tRNA ligase, partial [Spirochaetota bacterium]
EVSEKRAAKERRTYELSQLPSTLEKLTKDASMLIQMPFRSLANFLMITAGDIDAAFERFAGFDPVRHADQLERLRRRAVCAWNWISSYAPEDFRFELKDGSEPPAPLSEAELAALHTLRDDVRGGLDAYDEKSMQERIYAIAEEHDVDKKRIFAAMYEVLIGKERGPRLGGFLLSIGRDRLLQLLERY